MLSGFGPKSLLVNHALDCCLVAGGVAHSILPYMANNIEHCGMFVISKINLNSINLNSINSNSINSNSINLNLDSNFIDMLKLKIKELNLICNNKPFNLLNFNILNNEIKQILVDRENLKSHITILAASFTYIKNNSLVFDNIETNNKSFIEDENGNNIRYNCVSIPFMKCYAEYSKTAMIYNKDINISNIGLGYSDIQFENVKDELSRNLGFDTLNKYVENPEIIEGIYTDAKKQIILGDRKDFKTKNENVKVEKNKVEKNKFKKVK